MIFEPVRGALFFIDHLVSVFCGYWGVRLIWYRSSIIQPRFEVHCPWKMDSKECDSFWFCKLVWHPFTAKNQSCVTSKIKQFGNKSWSSNSSNGSKNQGNYQRVQKNWWPIGNECKIKQNNFAFFHLWKIGKKRVRKYAHKIGLFSYRTLCIYWVIGTSVLNFCHVLVPAISLVLQRKDARIARIRLTSFTTISSHYKKK